MKSLIQALHQRNTYTTNGMVTHQSSLDACVDLFFQAGAARNWNEGQILSAFVRAWSEQPALTLKLLFWVRDVRGGAGERRFFRICLQYLAEQAPEALLPNLHLVPEYGRWDDLFELQSEVLRPKVLELIREGLLEKMDGLLAKWLPRKGEFANLVRRHLGLSPKAYRKLIVGLSATVEQQMCAREWEAIQYGKVPSQAMNRYRKAFLRHDRKGFAQYILNVSEGKDRVNAGAIFPHEIYRYMVAAQSGGDAVEKRGIVQQWEALPDYMADSQERILPVCDVSGSMTGLPMDVSVALGLYISERNRSLFKDAFITFSQHPQLRYLKGDLWQRTTQLQGADWGYNTDLEAVFRLILKAAQREKLPETEMPTKILIISDMEFDQATETSQTALDMIDARYQAAGYRRPAIIFWNVNGRPGNVPAPARLKGTALVSGFSPSILKAVLQGDPGKISPRSVMLDTLESERYAAVQLNA